MYLDIGNGNSFSYSGAVSHFANVELVSGASNLDGSISGPVTVDAGAKFSQARAEWASLAPATRP